MKSDKGLLFIALWVPIVNIVLDMAMGFLTSLKTPIALGRVGLMMAVIAYFIANFKWATSKLNFILSTYLTMLFIVCLLSSDLQESMVDGFLKTSITMLMVPIGIRIGLRHKHVLVKPLFWVLVLLLANYAISQVFKLGVSVYEEDSFYKGGATASAPIVIVLSILVLFNAFNQNQLPYRKVIVAAVVALSLFVVILSVKRGAILALGVAAIIYMMLAPNKARSFKISVVTAVLFSLLAVQFSGLIMSRIAARTTEANELENENRYKETLFVIEELNNASVFQILFGNEAFHSQEVFKKYFGRERQLHVDYNILLHGTGFFGFALYFAFYYELYAMAKRAKQRIRKYFNKPSIIAIKEDFALVVAVLAMSLIMSVSGGLQFVSYRAILFLTIGVYIGQILFTVQQEHNRISQTNNI